MCRSKKRLEGKTVLVTGGTAGMGLEIARDFAERGARVIVACPYPNEGARAVREIKEYSDNHNVAFKFVDLGSFESTRRFAADIINTEDRLDILVNNAATGGPCIVSRDGLHLVMQINYYSTFLLTILLLPLLKKTGRPEERSRIVNVSSASYILGREYIENTFLMKIPPIPYFVSKLYLVLFSRELAKKLINTNVVVNNSDPGAVGTNIFFNFGCFPWFLSMVKFFFWVLFKHPFEGAQTTIHVALDKKAGEVSGEYFKNCRRIVTAKIACDKLLATKLWNKSASLVKLTDEESHTVTINVL